jgi:hypothetical protein
MTRYLPLLTVPRKSFVGYYHKSEIWALVCAAGFRDAIDHPIDELNARYFAGQSDHLRLRAIERLLTAIC